jgi:Protein of unknown function (DUF2829)
MGGRFKKPRVHVQWLHRPALCGGDNGMMKFGEALDILEAGGKIFRSGWNGKGMWLKLQTPGAETQMAHPYIYMEYPKGHKAHPNGCKAPWLASQADILAKDWGTL